MEAKEIQIKLNDFVKENSGLELKRDYLGMSGIGKCPLVLYREYNEPIVPNNSSYRNAYRGYMFEREVKKMLKRTGIIPENSKGRHLKAIYDERYQGHIDGEDIDGNLIEIKSVSKEKFEKVRMDNKLLFREYCQVQAYMEHGGYNLCNVVVICSETLEIHVLWIRKNEDIIFDLEQKAVKVLEAIDSGVPPKCECRKCELKKAAI